MVPYYGPLPSLKAADVWALGLFYSLGYIDGVYTQSRGGLRVRSGLGFRV